MIELFETDDLQQYCGYGLKICDGLELKQPKVGDIVHMGERKYFSMIHTLTAISSDMKAQLDMLGLDWGDVQDFELFCMLAPSIAIEDSAILFGNLDFSKFEVVPVEGERRCFLRHRDDGLIIDELRYKAIVTYLCNMHNITKKPQFAGNELTRKMLLEMAYEDLKKAERVKPKSALRPLISTLVNMPGCKYNLKQIMDIGFCEFMDSVARVQIITASQALLQGCYMGNIDIKKLNKSELNYMRDTAK